MPSNSSTFSGRALVVDDEPDLCELLELTLSKWGLQTDSASSLNAAQTKLKNQHYDLCLTDMFLPGGNGLDLVRQLADAEPAVPVAVITAYGSPESAVAALKAGAFDYLTKPVSLEQLRTTVQSALKTNTSRLTNAVVARPAVGSQRPETLLIGNSPEIVHLHSMIERLARSMAPVSISGESGSGKEVAARAIHLSSARADGPFIAVNCGAIPETLVEAEFFGYRKGAFTGAEADRNGFFQAAHGGTLFLDEVAELPLTMQVKLLRAIQERKVRKVGATQEEIVDVRLISATHRDLAEQVKAGLFREDLYYRLHVIELNVPALRQRGDDILLLADAILKRLAQQESAPQPRRLTEAARAALLTYAFPGNVRELENLLERASALCSGPLIRLEDLGLRLEAAPLGGLPGALSGVLTGTSSGVSSHALVKNPVNTFLDAPSKVAEQAPPPPKPPWVFPLDLNAEIEKLERALIEQAVTQAQGNRTAAAQLLGISFRHLRYRRKVLGLS